MRTQEAETWLALKARIDTLVTDPAIPVFEPDEIFTAPSDTNGPLPFILASDVRNDNVRAGIDPSLSTRSGTLMLAIQWPITRHISHTQLVQIGGTVAAHFPTDQRMKIGLTCLRVTREPDVMQPYRQDNYRVLMVRIPWSNT